MVFSPLGSRSTNAGLVWAFADDLDVKVRSARQIEWGFMGRAIGKPKA